MAERAPEPAVRVVRRRHEIELLGALTLGGLSREELSDQLSLSRTTISTIVADLINRGAVVATSQQRTGARGRPTTVLGLNPVAVSALGVELGRGHVSVAVVDFRRTVLAHSTVPVEQDSRTHWSQVRRVVEEVLAGQGLVAAAAFGVGVGVYGDHPDPAGQVPPVAAQTLEHAQRTLDLPVTWDNNVRLAALAEARAGAERSENLVYLVLSQGISTGLVVDGSLARGHSGVAGEIGHLVVDPDGPECECGARGCLTTYLALDSVLARARREVPGVTTLADLCAALDTGQPEARRFAQGSGVMLGRAVSMLTMVLDPEEVVVGGELARLGEHLLQPARELQARPTPGLRSRRTSLRPARIPEGAAAVGAAHLVLDRAIDAATR